MKNFDKQCESRSGSTYLLNESCVVPRSFEDVAVYLKDFSTIEQWDPGVFEAKKTTPGEVKVGSAFELVLNVAGKPVCMTYTMDAINQKEDSINFKLSGNGESFSASDNIQVTKLSDQKTKIDYSAKISLHNFSPALKALLAGRMNKLASKTINGLKTALTDEEPRKLSFSQRLNNKLALPAANAFTKKGYAKLPNKGLSQQLDGQTWIVTGATSGIGLRTAAELARLGARIIVIGRGDEKLANAIQEISSFSGNSATEHLPLNADLLYISEINRVAETLLAAQSQIHGLINNAGALFDHHKLTQDGIERAMAINLLAPYILTTALLPLLQKSSGRVINIASGGMYTQALDLNDMNFTSKPYNGAKAYARAKRALVWLNQHWATQHPDIHFSAMHPGWVATPGLEKSLPAFASKMRKRLRSPRMGADTIVWLASSQMLASYSGEFWFDRQIHPDALLPNTKVSAADGKQLLAWLNEHSR